MAPLKIQLKADDAANAGTMGRLITLYLMNIDLDGNFMIMRGMSPAVLSKDT